VAVGRWYALGLHPSFRPCLGLHHSLIVEFVTMNHHWGSGTPQGMSRVSSCLDGVLPFSEAVSVETAETSDIFEKVQMIRLLLQ